MINLLFFILFALLTHGSYYGSYTFYNDIGPAKLSHFPSECIGRITDFPKFTNWTVSCVGAPGSDYYYLNEFSFWIFDSIKQEYYSDLSGSIKDLMTRDTIYKPKYSYYICSDPKEFTLLSECESHLKN